MEHTQYIKHKTYKNLFHNPHWWYGSPSRLQRSRPEACEFEGAVVAPGLLLGSVGAVFRGYIKCSITTPTTTLAFTFPVFSTSSFPAAFSSTPLLLSLCLQSPVLLPASCLLPRYLFGWQIFVCLSGQREEFIYPLRRIKPTIF